MVTITDWNDLDAVRNDLDADYTLENDLDSSTAGYSGIGDDFRPIGFLSTDDKGNPFTGTLNGQGFQISDLVIEENSGGGGVAFITRVDDGGLVENLELAGTVDSTEPDFFFGGLTGSVGSTGTVQNCATHIAVTASSATYVGGLAGENGGTITDCYATGSVDGDNRVGGLVGSNAGTIDYSYATGSTVSDGFVGGLVGYDDSGSVSGSYWDTQSTGQSTSEGSATGLTTSEMQGDEASTNMGSFDFSVTWDTVLTEDSDTTADGYPILQSVDRQNQLEAQGIYTEPLPFEAYIQINGSVVQIQSAFTQDGGASTEITEAYTQDSGSSKQL